MFPRLFLCFSFLLLGACFFATSESKRNYMLNISEEAGLVLERVKAGRFLLTTLHKGLYRPSERVTIYIEGDGSAWKNKHKLSNDPTPINPVALKFAARDPASSIFYIARPCMYLKHTENNDCSSRYWSSHRYSEEIIMSINEAINEQIKSPGNKKLTIIGYSGGGVVAALVAARRDDVDQLVTVAANLDHQYWTELHKVSPLSGSLSPVDYLEELSTIKQLHFVGGRDEVSPGAVLDRFLNGLKYPELARVVVINDFEHQCCWVEEWPDLLKMVHSDNQ